MQPQPSPKIKLKPLLLTKITATASKFFFCIFAFFAKPKKLSEAKQWKLNEAKQTPAEQLALQSRTSSVQF